MKVRFTLTARSDLLEIGDFIAQDAPRRSRSFVAELRSAALALSQLALRCATEGEIRGVTIRRLTHDRYGIFYSVIDGEVIIFRVLEGSRNHRRLLGLD